MQFCVAWRFVTMQRLFGVDGDGDVEGFFAVFSRLFFGLLFGVEALCFRSAN